MKKILFVEDDLEYSKFLSDQLRSVPYEVVSVHTGVDAMEEIATCHYDLLLTDLELDILDGLRLVAFAKKTSPSTRSIILTGNPSINSEISSLDIDTDFYIEKNKSLTVILKYISHVLSMEGHTQVHTEYLSSSVENILMDLRKRTVYKNDVMFHLTPREFGLLEYFLSHKSELISREDLLKTIWVEDPTADNIRKVDVHLKNLRTKMSIFSIVTIRGLGYKWNEV